MHVIRHMRGWIHDERIEAWERVVVHLESHLSLSLCMHPCVSMPIWMDPFRGHQKHKTYIHSGGRGETISFVHGDTVDHASTPKNDICSSFLACSCFSTPTPGLGLILVRLCVSFVSLLLSCCSKSAPGMNQEKLLCSRLQSAALTAHGPWRTSSPRSSLSSWLQRIWIPINLQRNENLCYNSS